jgi:hypothetical protein
VIVKIFSSTISQLERHQRVVPDYAKRGYNKRCEDAFADLEKTIAALPADQAAQFRGALSPKPSVFPRPR